MPKKSRPKKTINQIEQANAKAMQNKVSKHWQQPSVSEFSDGYFSFPSGLWNRDAFMFANVKISPIYGHSHTHTASTPGPNGDDESPSHQEAPGPHFTRPKAPGPRCRVNLGRICDDLRHSLSTLFLSTFHRK